MRGKVVWALAVALLALGSAGCGGSDALTRAELVKQANAICKHRTADLAALQRKHLRGPTSFYAAAIPIADKSISELAALKAPKDVASEYHQFVTGARAQIDQVKRALAAFRAHRRPPQGEGPARAHRHAQITRALGLDACI